MITHKTPHYTAGRLGKKPEIIVIHLMDGSLAGTDSWFAEPKSQVSSHYGIGKKGEIHQYVEEVDTAWHAGRVSNPTSKIVIKNGDNPNYYSIGIEHEGRVGDVWTTEMKAASSKLIKEICLRHSIPIDREHIIGHNEVFASKPNCPGNGVVDELISMAVGKHNDASLVDDLIKKLEALKAEIDVLIAKLKMK